MRTSIKNSWMMRYKCDIVVLGVVVTVATWEGGVASERNADFL